MNAELIANIHTFYGILLFGLIAAWYIWPKLKTMKLTDALVPLLLFSAFRYMGLLFIYPGVSDLPEGFAVPAAYGDLIVSLIALVAAIVCRMGMGLGVPLAWLYTIAGTADFAHAIFRANQNQAADHVGAVWLVFLFGGPAFIVTLGLLFTVLIKVKN